MPKWDALPKGWNDYWVDAHRSEEEIEAEKREKARKAKEAYEKEMEARTKAAAEWIQKSNDSLKTNLELALGTNKVLSDVASLVKNNKKPPTTPEEKAAFTEPTLRDIEPSVTVYDKDAVMMLSKDGEPDKLLVRRDDPEGNELTNDDEEYGSWIGLTPEKKKAWDDYFFKRLGDRLDRTIKNATNEEFLISLMNTETNQFYTKKLFFRYLNQHEYDVLESLLWNYHRQTQADPDAKSNALMALMRFAAERLVGLPVGAFMRSDYNDLKTIVETVLYKLIHYDDIDGHIKDGKPVRKGKKK